MRLHSRYFIRGRIAGAVAFSALSLSGVRAQSQTAVNNVPEWQTAAGGKLSFDAASIKLGDPSKKHTAPNFALDFLDSFDSPNPHGRLVAQFPLQVYIEFAYKLLTYSRAQTDAMLAQVPKWVSTDEYVINAQTEGNPTKDQMRLMMQSLLADRFKLAVHFERQETQVLALVLDKPGKTGPKLIPHSDGPPCDVPSVFPVVCNAIMAQSKPNNVIFFGARDVTMGQIAAALTSTSDAGGLMVDQTGLEGRFDFSLEWTREPKNGTPADPTGATFREALQDQLGLKLKSTKVLVDTLVIDHVERPSEN
jgi:bla regulator protein BlaR1